MSKVFMRGALMLLLYDPFTPISNLKDRTGVLNSSSVALCLASRIALRSWSS